MSKQTQTNNTNFKQNKQINIETPLASRVEKRAQDNQIEAKIKDNQARDI